MNSEGKKPMTTKGFEPLHQVETGLDLRKSPNSSALDHSAMLPHQSVGHIYIMDRKFRCQYHGSLRVTWHDVYAWSSLLCGRMGVHGLTTYLHEHTRTLSTPVTFSYPPKNVVSLVVDGWS